MIAKIQCKVVEFVAGVKLIGILLLFPVNPLNYSKYRLNILIAGSLNRPVITGFSLIAAICGFWGCFSRASENKPLCGPGYPGPEEIAGRRAPTPHPAVFPEPNAAAILHGRHRDRRV